VDADDEEGRMSADRIDPVPSTDGTEPGRASRWLRIGVGVVLVLLGVAVLGRPLASVAVLTFLIGVGLVVSGIAELVDHDRRGRWSWVVPLVLVVAGLTLVLRPGLPLRWIGVVAGAALIVVGAARVIDGLRGRAHDRVTALLLGCAAIVLGLVAVAWPDLSTIVLGLVVSVWLIAAGLVLVVRGALGRGPSPAAAESPTTGWRRWVRVGAAVVALVLAVTAASVVTRVRAAGPEPDAFYAASTVPSTPGSLIRSEPFTRGVPEGARGVRILYSTTDASGDPALASGLVVLPATGSDHPVIAWAHGTTGYDNGCAPTLLGDPLGSGAFFLTDQVLERGWALVATDYVGLGTSGSHPYLIGRGEAPSVLDAVRAARELPDASLSGTTVVWGHSQGGNAALWTGVLATSYAPDVPLAGVAALSPASDLIGLVRNLPNVTGGQLFASYVVKAYAAQYDDVRISDVLDPASTSLVQEFGDRCLAEKETIISILELGALKDRSIFSSDPTTGAIGARLRENVPTGDIAAPLLIGQGLADPLVLPEVQQGYVDSRCAAGQELTYRTYAGFDHVGVVEPESPLVPDLLAWTEDRIAGTPAAPPTPCGSAIRTG
jgi:uncharacterized membrane protein HdeD (DUF308 family)/acetyl esterase/lipase